MQFILRRLLALWVRVTLRPDDAAARLAATTAPVCYVLEWPSATDLAVLQHACSQLKLPRPRRRLLAGRMRERRAWFNLMSSGSGSGRRHRRVPATLQSLIELLRAEPELDVALVPVAVYWGRAPQKTGSLLRLLLAEDWVVTSRLRRLFQTVLSGRDILVDIGDPIGLRSLLLDGTPAAAQGRRVVRLLRAQLRRQRTARIGPDLSHRRTIVNRVLRSRAVRLAAASLAREKGISRRQALLAARRYVDEVAANYSHAFVRFLDLILTRLWNRLYDGVLFEHAHTLEQVVEGHEIVYVPCHRSHMDYLLLSYVIYRAGYAIPHIAAGINLNLPVVGRLLRKGGAFFIRRSFRGNALYTAVFTKYLGTIMARGHSIEYFIEGGRSRTGRLLRPKTGMLSMTVRSFLRDPGRPILFVPVYFGYERIVEANTYIGELSGVPKKKESILGLLRAWRVVREKFGQVHVNLGEPIALTAVLERIAPDWRLAAPDDSRAALVGAVVDDLAPRVMRHINAAAAVTPINLLAITLLAMPRQTLSERDLVRQLELYVSVLRSFPYSDRLTITPLSGTEIIDHGEAMKVVIRQPHPLGALVRMTDNSAILATYFRNNVLHLFAMPSLVACAFISNAELRTEDIQRLAWRIYPYIASELYLWWSESELPGVIDRVLAVLATHRLLEPLEAGTRWRRPPPDSAHAVQLSLLAQATIQTIERYYLAISALAESGSGTITQRALEERCELNAQRMTMIYGINSPEFFDKALFAHFIDLLRERGVIRVGGEGRLEFDEVLLRVAADAQFVLSEQMRHSILQVTTLAA
jgi:glycerol-3-phosphate O-acyltransferase